MMSFFGQSECMEKNVAWFAANLETQILSVFGDAAVFFHFLIRSVLLINHIGRWAN